MLTVLKFTRDGTYLNFFGFEGLSSSVGTSWIGNDSLVISYITSTGLTEPKKSVIGTSFGFLVNKSFLTPTVDIQTLFGHTLS